MAAQADMKALPGPKFTSRNDQHVPFNKRRWEVEKSTAVLEIVDCPKGKWLSVSLEETTQAKPNGPFQTRTITFDLHEDDRQLLLNMLSR